MRPFSRETIYSVFKSIFLLIIFGVGLPLCGNVYAVTWEEPSNLPPLDNILAPLNVGTSFGNGISDLTNPDIIGTWDKLKIQINPCKNGQVLMWSTTSPYLATGQVYCGDPFSGGYWQLNGNNLYPNSLNYQIGIGTSTPNRALHVYNIANNAEIDIQSVSGSNNHWGLYVNKGDNSFNIWGGSNALTIARNGNVGIGTSTPTFAKLQILSTSSINFSRPLYVQGSSGIKHTAAFANIGGYGIALGSLDGKVYGLIQSAKFTSGGGESGANVPLVLNLADGNNVGIGIVDPHAKLEVNGQVMFGSATEDVLAGQNLIYGNIATSSVGNLLLLQNTSVDKFVIDADGNAISSASIGAPKLCIGSDCRTAWPVAVGGGGDSFWATSTDPNNIYNKNTGNVGIGTNSPIGKLDIGGFIATKVAPAIFPVAFISDNVNAISGLEMSNRNTGTLADFRFMITDDTGHYFAFSSPGKNNNGTIFGLARKTTDLIFNIAGTARDMAIGTLNATHLIFGTNGLERMRITSAGDVGIGTTLPKTDLEVIGVVSTTDLRANGSVVTNYIWGAAGVSAENIYLGDAGDNIIAQGTVSSTNIKASQICLGGNCITDWPAGAITQPNYWRQIGLGILPTSTAYNIGIGTSTQPANKLVVDGWTDTYGMSVKGANNLWVDGGSLIVAAGKIGVGTVSPNTKIEAYGDTSSTRFCLGGNCISSWPSGGGADSFWATSTNNVDIYNKNLVSKVGIGIDVPLQTLHISGISGSPITGRQILTIDDSSVMGANVGGGITLRGAYLSDNTPATFANIKAGKSNSTSNNLNTYLSFYTRTDGVGLAERLRINEGGNVGIGTASPDQSLSIQKSASVGDAQVKLYSMAISPLVNSPWSMYHSGAGANRDNLVFWHGENKVMFTATGDVNIAGSFNAGANLGDVAEEFKTASILDKGTVVIMGDDGYNSAKPSYKPYDRAVIGVVSDVAAFVMGRLEEKNKAQVAMVGVVSVKVTNEGGPIKKGDLLVTSSVRGHAMRANSPATGTVIGKALEDFSGRVGSIKALINLQ